MKLLNVKKKLLSVAVGSAISASMMLAAAPAQALNVSQDNLGEVLLFPYYTVKNGLDTVFTVTNTSDRTATFKIRFREALNSREVLDFNVVLSPFDHWSGAITASGDGAVFRTFDRTCTSPDKPSWNEVTVGGTTGWEVPFTNTLFSGIYADGATSELSRVQEGYFEVILMGVSTRSTSDSSNTVEYNAKHVSGVPRNCALVDQAFNNIEANFAAFIAPENSLKGHVTYIAVADGRAIDAEPTAIEDWRNVDHVISAPADVDPDLGDGDAVGFVNLLNDGAVVSVPYVNSQDGVSMALMATSVINEFATGAGASTSWVVTFPTKHHYTDAYTIDVGTSTTSPSDFAPFSNRFVTDTDGSGPDLTGRSCDRVSMSIYNREEGAITTVDTSNFSPRPAQETVDLCYEANVVDFNNTSVFGSGTNRLGVSTSQVGSAGWASLNFVSDNALEEGLGGFFGLPVIGFAAIMRDNGEAATNYGSSLEHAYKKSFSVD